MNSKLFGLTGNDALKSVITAVFAAVVVALGGIVTQPGFDVFTVDWNHVLSLVINVSVSTFIADMARRLTTDENGKLFGRIG